jgi:Fur family transcriptional regulator, ferric uptake regulator
MKTTILSGSQASPLQKAAHLLSEKGLKKTPSRLSILSLLLTAKKPLCSHDISIVLPGVDKVTVYRVLSALLENGIAHKIETRDHVWHFAVCGCGHTKHCHPHFSCRKCGKIECLPGLRLPVWKKTNSGRIIEDQELYLRGLCVHCSSAG